MRVSIHLNIESINTSRRLILFTGPSDVQQSDNNGLTFYVIQTKVRVCIKVEGIVDFRFQICYPPLVRTNCRELRCLSG